MDLSNMYKLENKTTPYSNAFQAMRYIGQQKYYHILKFHPEMKGTRLLNPRTRLINAPKEGQKLFWKCPWCEKGVVDDEERPEGMTEGAYVSLMANARRRHCEVEHKDQDLSGRPWMMGTQDNPLKAKAREKTRISQQAGMLSRILQRKAAGNHDLIWVKVPNAVPETPGRLHRRNTRTVALCLQEVRALAARPQPVQNASVRG